MRQNIKDRKILVDIIKRAKQRSDVMGMCIWGAFNNEVPGIHLGHLHMMNQLCELASVEGIQVSICINEEPVLDVGNKQKQEEVKQHVETTASMLRILPSLMMGGNMNIHVYIGRDETEKLRKEDNEKFEQLQEKLDQARQKIEGVFRPLQITGQNGKKRGTLLNSVRKKAYNQLKLKPKDFNNLRDLFFIHKKVHACTPWASQFGATLQLMKNRPTFLLVGERHRYIWALYDCMFRLVGLGPIPVICVTDFMDCVGKEAMNSKNSEDCIHLDDDEDMMRVKLLKGSYASISGKRFALRDIFEKILFANGRTITVKEHEYSNYQDLLNAEGNVITQIAEVAVESLRHRYISAGRAISGLRGTRSRPADELQVDNIHILNYIDRCLPNPMGGIHNFDESINMAPQTHRTIYDKVLENKILNFVLDPLSIDPDMSREPLVIEAFDKIKGLIRNTRSMDILPYQIVKRHRDHYYHQINVGGLGAMLLDVYNLNGVPLWRYLADRLLLKGNDEIKERKAKAIWWVTALLHDHAYSLEYAVPFLPSLIALGDYVGQSNTVLELLKVHRQVLRPMMADEIETKVFTPLYKKQAERAQNELRDIVSTWIGRMPEIIPMGARQDDICDMADNHGVIGAVNFLSQVSVTNLDRECEWRRAFEAIAGAILVHHLPTRPKVLFNEHPLSFLLVFTDEIQEWSRLLLHHGEYRACLDRIELRPLISKKEQPHTRQFSDYLEVVFPFSDEYILKDTRWDRERFHQDKVNNLDRLVLPSPASESNFPRTIKWLEQYPSRVGLS